MGIVVVVCDYCDNQFNRTGRRYNEAVKNNWRQFCSPQCQDLSKKKNMMISNCKTCGSEVSRLESAIVPSGNVFCSSHCSIKYSNKHRITVLTLAKKERTLGKPICDNPSCHIQIGIDNKLFCSPKCRFEAAKINTRDYVIKEINKHVKKLGRIPIKYELPSLYSRARGVFGSWNKAIIASGFKPNPVRFSNHFIANDGHSCDSLSEKIVDDWLFARKIQHLTKVKYPWKNSMTADFKVGDYWVELFGLCGQLKSYDNLMKLKLEKIKEYKLKFIGLYLSDLFPINHLEERLGLLRK